MMVVPAPGFTRRFAVMDGASEFLYGLWGPTRGRHARAVAGVADSSNRSVLEIMREFELFTREE